MPDDKHGFVGGELAVTVEESVPTLLLCPGSTFWLWKKEYPVFLAESKNSADTKGWV